MFTCSPPNSALCWYLDPYSHCPHGLSRNLDSHAHHAHLSSTSTCIHIPTSILSSVGTYIHMAQLCPLQERTDTSTLPPSGHSRLLHSHGHCFSLASTGHCSHMVSSSLCPGQAPALPYPLSPLTSACLYTHILTVFLNLCRFLHSKASFPTLFSAGTCTHMPTSPI